MFSAPRPPHTPRFSLSESAQIQFWARNAEEQYRRAGRDPAEMHHSCAKVLVGPHDADSWDEMIEKVSCSTCSFILNDNKKDVPRTGVHPVFQTAKGQVPLRNVLRAFCRLRPETGYCQVQQLMSCSAAYTHTHTLSP